MPAIITDRFRIKNAGDFVSSVGQESMYLFVGGYTPWENDNRPPFPEDTLVSFYNNWKDMLGAKRVTSNEVIQVIPRIDWVAGSTEFKVYDPADNDLLRSKFYVLSEDPSSQELNVYKLLQKNDESQPTTVPPTGKGGVGTGIVTTEDGHVWRYMYTIGTVDAAKFLTPQHMPVFDSSITPLTDETVPNSGKTPFPDGGHGSDTKQELGAYLVGVNVRLEFGEVDGTENEETITTNNDYRKIGLIFNPIERESSAVANKQGYRQTTRLTISEATTEYEQDTKLFSVDTSELVGAVVYHDTDNGILYISQEDSDLNDSTKDITVGTRIRSASGETANVTDVDEPKLVPYTGEILYIENRKPIPRAGDQIESLSIVLEF